MSLSRQDKQVLRFVYKKFPVPALGTERIDLRNRYQPATAEDIRCALNVSLDDCKELLSRLTTYRLIAKTYWYGSQEVSLVSIGPGLPLATPVSAARPSSVNPDDERYGNECYEITEVGITELNRQGKWSTRFTDHYWKFVVPVLVTCFGAAAIYYIVPKQTEIENLRADVASLQERLRNLEAITKEHDNATK